jgi:hypothetical protein
LVADISCSKAILRISLQTRMALTSPFRESLRVDRAWG